jgi:hypothetical protein
MRTNSFLLLLDNSAAFDTIDHSIFFLSRLETVFGIRSTSLQWFSLYRQNHTQYVSVNNVCSDSSPLHFGIPQGSVLGPVLFILYTTPLSSIIQQHAVNHNSKLFDDTHLQQSSKPADIYSTTSNS